MTGSLLLSAVLLTHVGALVCFSQLRPPVGSSDSSKSPGYVGHTSLPDMESHLSRSVIQICLFRLSGTRTRTRTRTRTTTTMWTCKKHPSFLTRERKCAAFSVMEPEAVVGPLRAGTHKKVVACDEQTHQRVEEAALHL